MNLKIDKPEKEYPALEKRKQNSERRAVWLRNYQRARARALVRLAQQYPDQYKDLLEQERLSDEAKGKKWLDISGRTRTDTRFHLYPLGDNNTSRSDETDTDEQNEGNVGGQE
jgi:hypothetical protein